MSQKGISMNGQPTGGMSMNGESIPVAQGTPIQQGAPAHVMNDPVHYGTHAMDGQEKVGSKCCGCCCDFRRAVIILDIILIIFAALGLIGLALPDSWSEWRYEQLNIDDDEVQDVVNEMDTITTIIQGCGVLVLAVPILGALKYNSAMVAFGCVWFVAAFIAEVAVNVIYVGKANDVGSQQFGQPFLNWIGSAIVTALYIYPHVGLFMEINQGIMSEATYRREEFSCCCV